MSPPRQGVLLWEIRHTQDLPPATQQCCRELPTHLLLAAVTTTPTNTEEDRDEREDPTESNARSYVYIRQSSMQQVRTRLEGQRRQYDLQERALTLGFERVIVIDEDLGRSGTGSVERPGLGQPAGHEAQP